MPFQLSPGVLVTETDLTNIIPAVATSAGAYAGPFTWGPVMDPVTVASENELVSRFGKPVADNAASWYTAANFLSYTSELLVARAGTSGQKNAVTTASGALTSLTTAGAPLVSTAGTGFTDIPTITISGSGGGTATATLKVVSATINTVGGAAAGAVVRLNLGSGREAELTVPSGTPNVGTVMTVTDGGSYSDIIVGSLTNVSTANVSGTSGTLTVNVVLGLDTVTASGGNYTAAPTLTASPQNGSVIATPALAPSGLLIKNLDDYTTNWASGSGTVGEWAAKYPGVLGNSLKVTMADSASFATWSETINGNVVNYNSEFDGVPGTSDYVSTRGGTNDELHILVIDEDGQWTGTKGGILEKFAFVSKASDARRSDGTNNYYKDVINNNSKYIWWMDHPSAHTGTWGTVAEGKTFTTIASALTRSLSGGADDHSATDGNLQDAFRLFADAERYDISLIPAGPVSATVAKDIVASVAETRKDCVVFITPVNNSKQPITGATIVNDTVTYRTTTLNINTSYAVLDSGWKYQYDRYRDTYIWVPLCGDVAGLCARTDYTNDPWWSPGGFNRGQIKNAIKLSLNPNKTERDTLYKSGVNPVVSFRGQGTVLYGDKTLLTKPSAFDRINVRRLFIVLEKAVATAAKYQLFEFNDSFTRAMFRSMVEPFLRDVQGRRGIVDFRVKCDETNNTGEVIDRNEFIADIFVKPARSINFITLNFIAARTGVDFEEIGA